MSQVDQVYLHLKNIGPLTAYEALELYGCFRLAARIRDLRDRGHDIHTSIIERGEKRFAQYALIKSRRAA